MISERDLAILGYLAAHPLASMAEVAKELGYRAETVARHIRSMKEREIYSGSMGLLCYRKLDIAYVPVLVTAPLENLEAVYAACRAHPYIAYSVRTLGGTNGAFLIFTQPCKAVHSLVEFLDELASKGIITDHRVYVCDDTRRDFLKIDMGIFDAETGTWRFDWNKWQSGAETAEPRTGSTQPQSLLSEPQLYKLDRSDMELLRLISDDVGLPTEEMARTANLPLQSVRRRIQKLEEDGFIIGYRSMINFSHFQLSGSMLFNCSAKTSEVGVCRRKLLTLPFPGTFIPVQNGFLLQASISHEGLPVVHRFLLEHCSNVAVSWFDLPTSDVALLNTRGYSEEGWQTDRAFLIDDPLEAIKKRAMPLGAADTSGGGSWTQPAANAI